MSELSQWLWHRRFSSLLVLSALVLVAGNGCRSNSLTTARPANGRFTVSLPKVDLLPMEYIQAVELEVQHGRVVSVNRLLDDWDSAVTWDTPGELTASCAARHFVSGLSDTKVLAGFITVEASGDLPLVVKATVHTSSTEPPGRPDRTLQFSEAELILKPAGNHD